MTKPKYREINIVPPMDVDIYAEPTWFIEKRALTDLQEQCDRLEKYLNEIRIVGLNFDETRGEDHITLVKIANKALAEYRKWKNSTKENE